MIEPNGLTTYYTYEDPLDRLTRIDRTGVAGLLQKESYSYPSPTVVIRQSDREAAGDLGLQSQIIADGWGRTIETRQYERPSQYIRSTTSYDELGRVKQTANPSRVDGSGQADGLAFGTTNTYDSLGRITRTVLQDQTSTMTGYFGNRVTVRDAAGKARTSVYDALGRVIQVIEDEGAGHRNYSTVYGYDAQDNLISIYQSGQSRTFVYDGLSRLRSATNPESGTTRYTYDANGNLLTKTDARNVMTCFGTLSGSSCASGYDAFGRSWAKSYSDGTPGVQYTYDAGGGFATGQLTEVANSNSRTSYSSHDAFGRPRASRQTTAGQSYDFAYTYNAAGSLRTEQYPSGRLVETGYDSANRPAWVRGTQGGAVTSYIGSAQDANTWVHYWPHGGIYYFIRGNEVWHAASYNLRLQQAESYEALRNDAGQMLFVSCPDWGENSNIGVYDICPHSGSLSGNGNLQSYREYGGGPGVANGLAQFNQSFAYDAVNRLQSASDSGGWSRSFDYDAFGNRWVTTAGGIATGGYTGNVYDPNTNRPANVPHDAAGNQQVVNGNSLAYDAENRQVSATEPPAFGGGTEQYGYDGEGRRVMKTGPAGTTVFVYDALGQLAAEYSNASQPASPCQTCYLSYDHLGSVRMITDQNGTVVSRHDYLPFGEEIRGGQAGRSGQFGSTNGIQQRFTGKERDLESGLDYFEARYYGSGLGRFMSPDPENAGAFANDPQSWNAYAYGRNNPLKYTDPDGLTYQVCDSNGENCSDVNDADFEHDKNLSKRNGEYFKNGSLYHYDSNGNRVNDGTYRQTDVDIDPIVASAFHIAGAQSNAQLNAFIRDAAMTAAGGLVFSEATAAIMQLAPATENLPLLRQFSRVLSNNSLKHIVKHLDEFQKLDPSMTMNKLVDIGTDVVQTGSQIGGSAFTKTVQIGGHQVMVRAVVNNNHALRSIHILQ